MDEESPAAPPSPEALFRFFVVSQVLARVLRGERLAHAVALTAREVHPVSGGGSKLVGKRTIYRWLSLYNERGLAGLERKPRQRSNASLVLPPEFLAFLEEQKKLDVEASIPELIKRAKRLDKLPADARVSRQTVYRVCKRLGLSVERRKKLRDRDTRRFAFPHRLQAVLCDGKHFRAGAARLRRVVFFFLDDATRLALYAVVGTSETAQLLLRGLFEVIRRYGFMELLYLDRGPGGIAEDTGSVCARLDVSLVLGEARYPEGRGKIERFNRTAKKDVIRHLDRRPDVDPTCAALELRFHHYLHEIYNHEPHESLLCDGRLLTPWERFSTDERELRLPESDRELRQAFVVPESRTVANDHCVPIDGIPHEVPRGVTGKIVVHRSLLDDKAWVLHEGRLVEIRPVDLESNAYAARARGATPDEEILHPLPKSAAELAYEQDWGPLVEADGSFSLPDQPDREE
jgi:transposase InsO family protein